MAGIYEHVTSDVTPRMGNRASRWFWRSILHGIGWKIKGQFPNEPKLIFIGAPHTSNWDFVVALASMQAVGVKASWMMKKEAFFWPLGGLFKRLGGVPIDRKAKMNVTAQMAQWFKNTDQAYLGITPEGTRSKVDKFKKGYLRMAYAAEVPVFIIALNGATKEVIMDKVFELSGDIETDNRAIKAYYDENYIGIRPEKG